MPIDSTGPDRPQLTLILPAFNEAARIANTISEAVAFFEGRGIVYEIIVAADGEDGTREIVEGLAKTNPALRVIGQNERRGKGRGIREAFAMARGGRVGFADADNKVPIEEYIKIEEQLDRGSPVVIGSRALEQSKIEKAQPWFRRLGARGFRIFMSLVVGLRNVSDTQCGFKFFRADVGSELFRLQKVDGYMYDVEILLLAQNLGFRIQEVPIRWRDDGDSRLQLVAGNLRNVADLFRIRLTSKAQARSSRAGLPAPVPRNTD